MTAIIPIVRNLLPGQYQIDNLVFGKYTTVRVSNFDIKPYDLNSGDFQTSRADEMRFGWDQLKPTTIEITFNVLSNKMRPGHESLLPNFWKEMPTVAQFQEAWKSDNLRYDWGEVKPLYVCGKSGITQEIYGRPGHFTYAKDSPYTEDVECLGEFRRSDTSGYSVKEKVLTLTNSSRAGTIYGTAGNAPSWFRMLMSGPAVKPTFTISGTMHGSISMGLDYTIAANEVVEINGYPWSRRAVSSFGTNLAAYLNGGSPYLDKLRFESKSNLGVSFNAASGTSSATKLLVLYKDAYQVIGS